MRRRHPAEIDIGLATDHNNTFSDQYIKMKDQLSILAWASSCVFGLIALLSVPGAIGSSGDRVIVSLQAGECSLTVEANDEWHTLRLRAHHPEHTGCDIARASMLSALGAAFSKTGPPRLEGNYSSLSIGRLMDYPWLSEYLATAAYHDAEWNPKKGKPAAMEINKYVSQLLFRNELTAQIDAVLEKNGYRVAGVTVEKVLVGGFRDVPLYQGEMHPGRVPYDAQVWFRLEKN